MDFTMNEVSDEDLVTQWINSAAVSRSAAEKLEYFHKLQEVLIRKSPHLLPKFLQNMLNFTTDRNGDVKKALVGFIEELCKMRESLLPKVMLNLHMLLCDESIAVQKRVIQALISIYRKTLAWLCKASVITEEMENAWKQLSAIKLEIANMIDSDNDGIRTSSVKFLECVVLLQTYPDQEENKKPNDFSLDDVPLTLKLARRRKLEEEANTLFELLLKFFGSPHISSANLLTCLGVVTNIAKNRTEFMSRVVSAIESLYNNLPPTLTTTQVNSVRKKLKSELAGLIKHPAAYEFVEKLTPMLTDLGYSQQDILKMVPKPDERRKYCKRTLSVESLQIYNKRPRLDPQIEFDNDTNDSDSQTLQELNENFVSENFTLERAVQMVFASMSKLPATMSPDFAKEYGKYVDSGKVGQFDVLTKLIATYLTEAGVSPSSKSFAKKVEEFRQQEKEEEDKEEKEKLLKKERAKVPRIKTLKLSEITKPIEKETKEKLLIGSINRLLTADKTAAKCLYQKLITTIAACFSPTVRQTVLAFLLSDLRSHIDLALAWLFEEYGILQGFSRVPPLRKDTKLDKSYNILLCTFINACMHDSAVLCRLFLEAPLITDEALDKLHQLCRDEKKCTAALGLLHDLTVRKPPKQLMFLNALLSYTTYELSVVRECAIGHVLELHKKVELRLVIEEFARMNLEFLKLQRPPESLCGFSQGRLKSETWGDDFIKACLIPYISLLPANESLIHDLAKVYVQTGANIKRIILRLLETPIRSMGMDSPELLKLVEECPKGSETLVTRVIHVLTDKGPPSAQLVQRVRELYHTRVSDVRFLIPVLNGLSKKEVIAALPKLIKLNPVVVREVFNRLLGLHGDSPITPTELLVALHLIDSTKADLKTIIKATSMCLQEKQVFTQEVLAVVLQQLMDQTPLPTLLMRTVIQALGSYPRLSGFVMNILQRLILKQVWKQKVVWEGFIKCCQRTKPQSFTVLMQLPPPQLSDALSICPELREPLKEHLLNFTEGQRSHIPPTVQEIILGSYAQPPPTIVPPPVVVTPEEPIAAPPTLANEPLPPGME
ncbi:Symplekin-like Protein [Tribolium castaneum]|uniref:Symplekin-like Protein n=1 Tax=Tribolium castaneum TaxID=7070 RepID=D6WKQ1_TRICA|nr:PREDICTED: symplekin [Tribolium castaneum]EFA02993.1 Symplekin-like Protein [Tribolium castaneum]|eukprot:XP_008200459.1 PREDICTED: symplekin [Tribolium castaneum]